MYENNDLYLLKMTRLERRLIIFFKRCIAVSEYLAIDMTALDRGDPLLNRGGAGYELKGCEGGGGSALPP